MQVPNPDEMIIERSPEMYRRVTRSVLHHIDICRPPVGEVAPVSDHSSFLAWFDDDRLGCEVDAGT